MSRAWRGFKRGEMVIRINTAELTHLRRAVFGANGDAGYQRLHRVVVEALLGVPASFSLFVAAAVFYVRPNLSFWISEPVPHAVAYFQVIFLMLAGGGLFAWIVTVTALRHRAVTKPGLGRWLIGVPLVFALLLEGVAGVAVATATASRAVSKAVPSQCKGTQSKHHSKE